MSSQYSLNGTDDEEFESVNWLPEVSDVPEIAYRCTCIFYVFVYSCRLLMVALSTISQCLNEMLACDCYSWFFFYFKKKKLLMNIKLTSISTKRFTLLPTRAKG